MTEQFQPQNTAYRGQQTLHVQFTQKKKEKYHDNG